MDNIITALGMAWGNFLSIPCPIRRWDEKQRNLMLAVLPVVGLIVGLIWFVLGLILHALPIPAFVSAIIMTLYIFGISGFAHLKGFGNCADAVISRGQKRRGRGTSIFSLVSIIVMVLLMFVVMMAFMGKNLSVANFLSLIVIPIISRTEAGDSMLKFSRRLSAETATYTGKSSESGKFVLISSAIASVLIILVMLGFMSAKTVRGVRPFVFAAIVTLIVTAFTAAWGKNTQKTMNGDAASFAICIGELIGLFALVFGTIG